MLLKISGLAWRSTGYLVDYYSGGPHFIVNKIIVK